jgi:hypothetical protein
VNISPCPAEGQGVNRWTFKTACRLFRRGWNEENVRSYLSDNTTRVGAKADVEVERAIERAPQWIRRGAASSCKKWPHIDHVELQKALSNGIGVEGLRRISPLKQALAHQVCNPASL